ncbi:MAG: SH3 domain-containing protein, partial [Clostridia bacterium]|nr:SH3 domain-containing protein [Clostridia bacterium]
MKTQKKRALLTLLLCCLVALPAGGMAGNPYDPFVDLGLAAAMKGTPYEDWYSHWGNVYCDEAAGTAFAVLQNHEQRLLFELTNQGAGWRIDKIHPRAICQSATQDMVAYGEGDDLLAGNLILQHSLGLYGFENFVFVRQGDQWVLDHAYARSPHETYREAYNDGTEPTRICYIRWVSGALVYDGYVEDAYGRLPDAQKVAEPGSGYWIPAESPRTPKPWPQPITLDTFDIETFPRDPFTQAHYDGPDSDCAWKLGKRDPRSSAVYAVVNNPNPKDRLNLRAEPSTNANYLGKYYNGMAFRVTEELPGGWVRVVAGMNNVSGYMRREFLAFGDEGLAVKNVMPRFTSTAQSWPLYYLPFDES